MRMAAFGYVHQLGNFLFHWHANSWSSCFQVQTTCSGNLRASTTVYSRLFALLYKLPNYYMFARHFNLIV